MPLGCRRIQEQVSITEKWGSGKVSNHMSLRLIILRCAEYKRMGVLITMAEKIVFLFTRRIDDIERRIVMIKIYMCSTECFERKKMG